MKFACWGAAAILLLSTVVAQDQQDASAFLPTRPNSIRPPEAAPKGMAWIPGGEFSMGVADSRGIPHGGIQAMEDARPIHRVYVDGFWMHKTDVTNAEFARFVAATGYVT